jgi:hypothetical protein
MYLEEDQDLQDEGLEESPTPDEAEGKKNKNEEDDWLAKRKEKSIGDQSVDDNRGPPRMVYDDHGKPMYQYDDNGVPWFAQIEAFITSNNIDPEQLTVGDLQCLVQAFAAREEAEKIYNSEPFKELLATACEDFPNYNNDTDDLAGVMDCVLAEARDLFAEEYDHPAWLCIAGELASMLHGGLT